jgi:phosphopantothenate---cysteine ligase (CTP)
MNILITSGGTTEKIDEVRSISNNSTGKLGKAIAEAFSSLEKTEKIYYLCGLSALLPETSKAEVRRIGSVAELETEVRRVLSSDRIDAVIHCMAVSDYSVGTVTTSKLIGSSICECIRALNLSDASEEKTHSIITDAVLNTESISNSSKISSDMDDLVLILKKTPKIISLFKQLAPEAVLVGFKLLNDVSLETLIETGYGVLEKNNCDFVLANDLKDISSSQHIGYLIDKNKAVEKMTGKKEIADSIVLAACKRLSRNKSLKG